MEQGPRPTHQNYIRAFTIPPTLRRVDPAFSEIHRALPRL
jgi:hypothetical protein